MCDFREQNKCKVNNGICPWVYYCDRVRAWKELSKAPKTCRLSEDAKIPNGFSKVVYERRGYLYIRTKNEMIKILNPYDYIPEYVKIYKSENDEWKIEK